MQVVARGRNGLQGLTIGLQGVTSGYKRLQWVTRGYRGYKGF